MWCWQRALMKCWIGQRGNENTQRRSQMNTATEQRDFSKSLHQKKVIYSPWDEVSIKVLVHLNRGFFPFRIRLKTVFATRSVCFTFINRIRIFNKLISLLNDLLLLTRLFGMIKEMNQMSIKGIRQEITHFLLLQIKDYNERKNDMLKYM